MSDTIQWFQYKPGLVGETQRVTHCTRITVGDRIRSWCRREFDVSAVEEAAEPGAEPGPGQVAPCGPCVPCLLLATAATEQSPAQPPARAALAVGHP
ncbi:hypothetical protein GCM10027271_31290 [Saccharopolyspora gloriosae]|uniref:Uncharacterized protein n=1 Tax=Saccharopolyspora gloriosae TaxID=455344 RepID=A0A840NDG6_9PSEU|nr:hypothetical protein [Saccharopolyspora gloriosae]MBB5069970.1 hypothetical protein [Saccharopolyspora gloriosae]